MDSASYETDRFLKLLTDALRAGPGSPAWHEAVREVRTGGLEGADEMRLLLDARERLQSGKDYRTIRAGEGFTRKLMGNIAAERDSGADGRRLSTARLIAIVSGLAVVAAAIALCVMLSRGGNNPAPPPAETAPAELLAVFTKTELTSTFAGGIPADWRAFGALGVTTRGGELRSESPKREDLKAGASLGGGIVSVNGRRDAFAIEADIRMDRAPDHLAVEVFVADEAEFGAGAAMAPREAAGWVQGRQVKAVAIEGDALPKTLGEARDVPGSRVKLTVKVDRQFVVVEADGKLVFAGRHNLQEDRPRYAGIRFLVRGSDRLDSVGVERVRVLRP